MTKLGVAMSKVQCRNTRNVLAKGGMTGDQLRPGTNSAVGELKLRGAGIRSGFLEAIEIVLLI